MKGVCPKCGGISCFTALPTSAEYHATIHRIEDLERELRIERERVSNLRRDKANLVEAFCARSDTQEPRGARRSES